MQAEHLLTCLAAQQIQIRAINGRLEVSPASLLTDELRAEIKAHKSEFLALLSTNGPKQNRYLETYAAIKAFYLLQGRTAEEWDVVNSNPAKFNPVWREMLGMKPSDKPPFIGGNHD